MHVLKANEIFVRCSLVGGWDHEKERNLPKIKEYRDFLPQDFDNVPAKMRKDSTYHMFPDHTS